MNTTADYITVLDHAVAQIPDPHRHGNPLLLRSGSASSSHGFLARIRALRDRQHLDIRFSVDVAITGGVREAIWATTGWISAIDVNGDMREQAEICEITGRFSTDGWPEGTRFIVRGERPRRECRTPAVLSWHA